MMGMVFSDFYSIHIRMHDSNNVCRKVSCLTWVPLCVYTVKYAPRPLSVHIIICISDTRESIRIILTYSTSSSSLSSLSSLSSSLCNMYIYIHFSLFLYRCGGIVSTHVMYLKHLGLWMTKEKGEIGDY